MPNISFQPVLRDVKDVLNSDFYIIPRFQRPYSWSSENLDDFWRDVVVDNEEGYFIGPMVAYQTDADLLGMVDGQQRITSITLAICALRDLFQTLQASNFASGLGKYIERKDDDSVSHFVLRSDAAGVFLKTQIQMPLPRTSMEASNEEERALKKAFEEISLWLSQQIEGLATTHQEGPELSPAAIRLRTIRDKILALQVIWIRLDNEDDAYVIFETLNSRGKDLETVDLLKNLLLGAVRAENGDLDSARLSWTDMRLALASNGDNVNPNKFILHWWLSQKDYTAERKLFRLIRKQFHKPDAPKMLGELKADAELYARIANPAMWECSTHEREVRASLEALNLFGVRQPRPLLLALLRAHRDGVIKIARVRTALRAIESYHFIATAIVGVSSTGGLSVMYASHARQVSTAATPAKAHASIDALVVKLQKGVSNRDTFVSEFGSALYYSAEVPDKRRLVQYVLRNIHDYVRKGFAFDHSKCNLEHITPQSDPKPWTADIGNLLWVDAKLNQKLGNLPFDDKKPILQNHSQAYDFTDLLGVDEWGQTEVDARRKRLAELAYDKVWKILG